MIHTYVPIRPAPSICTMCAMNTGGRFDLDKQNPLLLPLFLTRCETTHSRSTRCHNRANFYQMWTARRLTAAPIRILTCSTLLDYRAWLPISQRSFSNANTYYPCISNNFSPKITATIAIKGSSFISSLWSSIESCRKVKENYQLYFIREEWIRQLSASLFQRYSLDYPKTLIISIVPIKAFNIF